MPRLRSFSHREALIEEGLSLFQSTVGSLGERDGVMLSGGQTPLELYRRVADAGASSRGVFFLSDERVVATDDPLSNYGAIRPFFPSLLRVRTELPIEEATRCFDADLRELGSIPLGFLGMGADGHTASLFTIGDAARKTNELAIAVHRETPPERISVTRSLLLRVDRIVLLVPGEAKREVVRTLLDQPGVIPAGVALANHPRVEVWTDVV